ncbi:hypothetical protein HKX48_000271 [Thoreauomyces humboldtii]|nr:hypothetical protein HKX48_000271 [Thoreauomyces humboldtii]
MIKNYFKPIEGNENSAPDSMLPCKKRGPEGKDAETSPAVRAQEHSHEKASVPEVAGKRRRLNSDVETSSSQPEGSLTLAQEERIATQKRLAMERAAESAQLALERRTMGADWYAALQTELHRPYFLALKQRLASDAAAGHIIYPPPEDIYSFTKCPLAHVKVVILGQDPYHGPGQAHGLSFSVRKGVPAPPSLNNIFKELGSLPGFIKPSHGSLTGWAEQGVLLLNATLTVQKGKANSHKDIGWSRFTDRIISYLDDRTHFPAGVVFMLWGAFAQKKAAKVDAKRNLVLTSKHPSPLSANQGGWFGSAHFAKANAWLSERGIQEIDWNCLP